MKNFEKNVENIFDNVAITYSDRAAASRLKMAAKIAATIRDAREEKNYGKKEVILDTNLQGGNRSITIYIYIDNERVAYSPIFDYTLREALGYFQADINFEEAILEIAHKFVTGETADIIQSVKNGLLCRSKTMQNVASQLVEIFAID